MIDLALHAQAGPLPLGAIALRRRVSLSCVEQMFARLRKAGLVESIRGPGGGYRLGREATAISLDEIVGAADGRARTASGLESLNSLAHGLFQRLDAVMQTHMADIRLSDLVAGHRLAGFSVEAVPPRRVAIAPRPHTPAMKADVPNSVFALGTVMATAVAASDGH